MTRCSDMINTVIFDFGGVITSSPFEAFARFEQQRQLPKDFIRTVNSTNPDDNAWAKLENSDVKNLMGCSLLNPAPWDTRLRVLMYSLC